MELTDYLAYSPYDAMLYGKDEQQQGVVLERFRALPERIRQFLTVTTTAEKIFGLVQDGTIPKSHATAVGKMVFLVCSREIPTDALEQLLAKLDLPQAQAAKAAQALTEMLEPVLHEPAVAVSPQPLRQIPPMTRPLSPQTPPRNIIDLRKQPPNA